MYETIIGDAQTPAPATTATPAPAPSPAPVIVPTVTRLPWPTFLQRVLSDNGEPSSSRVLTLALAAVCASILCILIKHVCKVSDAAELGLWLTSLPSFIFALIALINAPYLINKGSGTLSDVMSVFKKGQ
jgi:hypothetical protein